MPDSTQAANPRHPRYATLTFALCLIAAATLVYSNSFRGVLVWDDVAAIVENPNIRSIWPLSRSMSAAPDLTVSGRPTACLSLALNYALAPEDARDVMKPGAALASPWVDEQFYRNVWGYHAFNLTVHVLAALTLFGVVRRSLRGDRLRERFGGASAMLAFLVALIWVVHPLHTESVTYVVQRVESLMGLFYLLTLYCAIRAAEVGPHRSLWTAGAVAACACGMGSKEVMVTAPLMVWLWDRLVGPTNRAGQRWRLYAGLVSTWVILFALVASGPRPHSVGFGLGEWTWWTYLRTQVGVVAHYLRLAVVPVPLVFDYDWRASPSLASVWPQAACLTALIVAAVVGLFRRWPSAFLAAWVFGILAPTSSILPIPTEVAAEHRMYLPLAAVVAFGVVGTWWLVGASRSQFGKARDGDTTRSWERRAAIVGLVACALVVAVCGHLTYARNEDYSSLERLMLDTLEKSPKNARAGLTYGMQLLTAGKFADAEAPLRVAVALDNKSTYGAHAHMYLGCCLSRYSANGSSRFLLTA